MDEHIQQLIDLYNLQPQIDDIINIIKQSANASDVTYQLYFYYFEHAQCNIEASIPMPNLTHEKSCQIRDKVSKELKNKVDTVIAYSNLNDLRFNIKVIL